jgi:hypothetical protein
MYDDTWAGVEAFLRDVASGDAEYTTFELPLRDDPDSEDIGIEFDFEVTPPELFVFFREMDRYDGEETFRGLGPDCERFGDKLQATIKMVFDIETLQLVYDRTRPSDVLFATTLPAHAVEEPEI